ncbi:hypothetical protein QA943_23695 [Streptomyces sp. B21-097]|uniref:hypothetical protein n=1 Tax=Streptomyces sp. B21-097 TaxID=3039414 RepID=UPI002FF10A36
MPLEKYQLTRADHRRQEEAVAMADWVQRQVAKAPQRSDEKLKAIQELLGPTPHPSEFARWRMRLYCGHMREVRRSRSQERPDGGITDHERCMECGLDPSMIVAFEPLVGDG